MPSLLALDHSLFFLIHGLPHSILTDTMALTLSGIGMGGLIWFLLSILIFVRIERRDHWFFLPVVLAASLSEFFANTLLKDFFARNRPPGSDMTDYSFPSGHATFAWALAIVLAAKEPRLKYFYYLLALAISLSRVYLGKHYPADIVFGSIVGLVIGYGALWIERAVIKYRHVKAKRTRTAHHARRSRRG